MGALLTQFMNKYAYTDFHELNADWIIRTMMELINQVENFVSLNAIKYADPIQWDITRQYEKNTVVIDPITGTAYISVAPVPSGVALTRTEYWTVVFDLGSFVTRAAKNFSNRYEADTTLTATFPSAVGDWLVWGDTLYEVISPITAGDQYVINSNIKHFTMEEVSDALAQAIQNVQNNVDALDLKVGDLNDLNTTDKTSVVNAINEVLSDVNNIYFDTASDLLDADVSDGDVCTTLGYYSANDGGGASYKIVTSTASPFYLTLNNGLIAELLYHDSINILCLGAKNDIDCSGIIQQIIDAACDVIVPSGIYPCEHEIIFTNSVSMTGCPRNMYLYDRPQLDFADNTDLCCVNIDNGKFVNIKNISISGRYNVDSSLQQYGIKCDGTSYIHIEGVSVYYCYYGIYLTHTWGSTFNRINVRYCYYAVYVYSVNNATRVVNTSFDHVYTFNSEYGYYITGDHRLYISNSNTDTCKWAMIINFAWVTLFNFVFELYDTQGVRIDRGAIVDFNMCYWLPDASVLYYDITILDSTAHFYNCNMSYLHSTANVNVANGGELPSLLNCIAENNFGTSRRGQSYVIFSTPTWSDSVTLEKSAADFKTIDVYWKTSNSSGVVTLRNNETVYLNNTYSNSTNTYMYSLPVSVADDVLTIGAGYARYIYGTTVNAIDNASPAGGYMIAKVVGNK